MDGMKVMELYILKEQHQKTPGTLRILRSYSRTEITHFIQKKEVNDVKMALKEGQIFIKEADNVQFQIIKSWGKMKWSRASQTLSGVADIELLNKLAGLVNLPVSIEAERKRLNRIMAAVDKERVNENPVPMIDPPIKVSPFKHQIRGYNMALMVLGLIEPPKK